MTNAAALEVNFDGLVGPTHNYAGLAHGNLASAANEGAVSNPREAALQGLAKMRRLVELGLAQAVLPPHERPHIPSLRRMGFSGSDAHILQTAARVSPVLLANVSSASAMWTANAATVTPSADAADRKVHLTPANLSSHFHRALEADTTTRLLHTIFADSEHFVVHDPVCFPTFGDEGAANHCRLARAHGDKGLQIFVYGRSAFAKGEEGRFSARQSLEASHIIATTHALQPGAAAFARQSKRAVDAGAFHNDVVSVTNEAVFLFHEHAFEDRSTLLEQVRWAADALQFAPVFLEARADELSLEDAVRSYLFNSQIITLPGTQAMAIVLPHEVEETPSARAYVDRILQEPNPIGQAIYFDLRQSMRNGGGPACLRLRVVLTETERAALGARVMLDVSQIDRLEDVVRRLYRDRLEVKDLGDPQLLEEGRAALDAFSDILGLGSIYDFQRA